MHPISLQMLFIVFIALHIVEVLVISVLWMLPTLSAAYLILIIQWQPIITSAMTSNSLKSTSRKHWIHVFHHFCEFTLFIFCSKLFSPSINYIYFYPLSKINYQSRLHTSSNNTSWWASSYDRASSTKNECIYFWISFWAQISHCMIHSN